MQTKRPIQNLKGRIYYWLKLNITMVKSNEYYFFIAFRINQLLYYKNTTLIR